ncbi:DUF342 domain-containing protein [Methanosarcina sp. KYL-1]|nr:DUF342 domain-containing protein [Methanosarcina sp. KYL-1]
MEKKLVCSLALLIMFFAVLPFSAAAADEETFLKYTSSGNAFGGGDYLLIDEDIEGDLVLGGSQLTVNGNIGDDFIGAGGSVIVNGDVSGNIIAAGGSVRVNGNVGGDLVAAGGEIFLSEDSTVEGDALIAGGDVTLNGVVNGDGSVSAGTLNTGNDFELKGDLELEAGNVPAGLEEQVGGNLSVIERPAGEGRYEGAYEGFGFFGFLVGLLASLALGLILIYLFPGFVAGLSETVRASALKAGLAGLAVLFFLPILSVILLVTVFGWSLSVLLFLLLALSLLISTVPVKLLAGEVIYTKLFKKEAGKMLYYFTGVLVFAVIYEIPFLGDLVRFGALLVGLGAISIWLLGQTESRSSGQ